MIAIVSALLVGAGTGLALFAAHYALDHLAPGFRRHPPRAYTVGVGILFAGYATWGAINGALATVGALAVVTALAGGGTWLAYWWHGCQWVYRDQGVTRDLEGDDHAGQASEL